MATVDPQLYRELRIKYPEVPEKIVSSYMTKFGNDRQKCMEVLTQESPRYLYGNQALNVNDLFGESCGIDPRPRSDSSSSNMSNASSGSVSSRPAYNTSHSFSNTPGHRGPITFTPDDGSPTSAPVRPSDFNQFLPHYQRNDSTHIPQINCNSNAMRKGHEGGQFNNFGGSMGPLPSGNSPTQPVNPGVLRNIEVKHIKSMMDQSASPVQHPQTISYQTRIDRLQSSSSPAMGKAGLPTTPERGEWSYHTVTPYNPYSSHYQGNSQQQNTAFSPDLHSLPIAQLGNMNLNPGGNTHFQSEECDPSYKHKSQTCIYLTPVASNSPHTNHNLNSPDRISPGQFQNSAVIDPRSSPIYVRVNPSDHTTRDFSNSQSPQRLGGQPVILEVRRDVQAQIQFFNEKASGSNTTGHLVGGGHGSVIGPNNQLCEGLLGGGEQAVINNRGVSPSQEEDMYLKFPPMSMPNKCKVPEHQQGPLRHGCCGSDSDTVFRGGRERDYRSNSRPFLSPTSSQSSASSDASSAISNNRPPPPPDEAEEYTQVLLSHQNSRMQKLSEDLSAAEDRLHQLKKEVNQLQLSSIDRQRKRSPFPSAVDLTKLRGENLQLQADIQLMTREIDMYNNGQTPLGVLDPLEEQNFYTFTNTGQRGSIYASSGEPHPTNKVFTSTVTTSVSPSSAQQQQPPQPQPPQRPRPEIQVPPIPPRDKKVEPPPPLPPRSIVHVPPPPPHQPAVGSGDSDADGEQWSCSACTFLNHPALNKCECCEMPRMNFSSSSVAGARDVIDTYPNSSALQSTQSS